MANNNSIEQLKFPIGQFIKPEEIEPQHITDWIRDITLFPVQLKELVEQLTSKQLHYKYRPDGWTIKQVVHHCADSHMNSFIRFKLTLTEETPTIKPYFEDKWAELPDTLSSPIEDSIKILEGLHSRWVTLLKSFTLHDWTKEFIHPEHGKKVSIGENIGIYAWHCNHHMAHIRLALENKTQ